MHRSHVERRWSRLIVLGMMILGALASTGCGGSKKATVTGKVTYKGEPLGNGNVLFIGADNKSATSSIDADGNYRIVNPPLGAVKITVETIPVPEAMSSPGIQMPDMKGKIPTSGKYVKIPLKYKDAAQSDLSYQVKSGNQTYNITLD